MKGGTREGVNEAHLEDPKKSSWAKAGPQKCRNPQIVTPQKSAFFRTLTES